MDGYIKSAKISNFRKHLKGSCPATLQSFFFFFTLRHRSEVLYSLAVLGGTHYKALRAPLVPCSAHSLRPPLLTDGMDF